MTQRIEWREDGIGFVHGHCPACGATWPYAADRAAIEAKHRETCEPHADAELETVGVEGEANLVGYTGKPPGGRA